MNHKQILNLRIGKKIIETSAYGVQCVGWAKEYCRLAGRSIGPFGGSAISGWNNEGGRTFNPKKWRKVLSTPLNYPPEGAVIFWSEKRCKYGHVSISNRLCNPVLLRYSDQNGGGKGEAITHRWSGYKNVLGWYEWIG